MIAVTVLLLVVLGALNVFNAVSNIRQAEFLLDDLGRQAVFFPRTDGQALPPPAASGAPEPALGIQAPPGSGVPEASDRGRRHGFLDEPMDDNMRMSALYFVVRLDSEGQVQNVDLRHIASVDKEEAEALASQAMENRRGYGRIGEMKYQLVETAADCQSLIFLDIGMQQRSVLRTAVLSVMAGILAWCAMLVLVWALSRRAIRPIAENMERQRQFVTDAGHGLKTPLAIILANAEAMELTGGETRYSRNIRSQVTRLSGLTQNLLTLARIDESSVPPDLTELPFSQLALESLEMFREPASLKNIRMEEQIPEGLCLRANRQQMSQLLSILLDNAVKYCPEGGRIALELRQEDKLVLRLRNTAPAEKVDVERIFDRCYRADSSRSRKSGGYGIGLSAAQAIVQLYKGQIQAAYEGDDIVFTVKL